GAPPARTNCRYHVLPRIDFALGRTARREAFRQARPLAEGQKSANVKHDFTIPPPPPTKTVGGGGRISREICRFFTLRAITWRRGVKSPRKMQVLMSSSGHWAEGVLRSEVPPDWWRFEPS